jgi:hypothetical protein
VRWSAGVVVALVALSSSGGCGQSTVDPDASPGASGGSTGGTDTGSGGCADTRADCACDSPDPGCARSVSEFCVLGYCPPTLGDLRQPETWLSLGDLEVSSLMRCEDGEWYFEIGLLEGGSSVGFDAEGNLLYAAHHSSCNEPVCGKRQLSGACRSCTLSPFDTFPGVNDDGSGGQPTTPEVYVPCQVDESGKLVLPAD